MSETRKRVPTYQHQPLLPPREWQGQKAALIRQIDRMFDDLYQKVGQMNERLKKIEEGEGNV